LFITPFSLYGVVFTGSQKPEWKLFRRWWGGPRRSWSLAEAAEEDILENTVAEEEVDLT
jgi:hypothetical protein